MTADKIEPNNCDVSPELPSSEKPFIDETSKTKEEVPTESPNLRNEEDEEPEWQDILGSGSILKKLLKKGEPDTKPQRLEKCVLNYELSLEDGTIIETKENYLIHLGDCEVVQGLDVSLGLMNAGEKCILKIEPRLAFGALGLQPFIPPHTKVVYEVELVSVGGEDDIEALPLLERKELGNAKRERGNWWYGRGENSLAIQCYRRALDFLEEVEGGGEIDDSTLQGLLEDRVSVCNNMAAAQIKLELYDAALNSLQTVLRAQPNNVKALFRKAKVYKSKNDPNAALKCLKKAVEISPNNQDVVKEIVLISKIIQKQKVTEKELAKRMFGGSEGAKTEINGRLSDKKHKKPSALVWSATAAASFAIGLVGLAAYRLKFA